MKMTLLLLVWPSVTTLTTTGPVVAPPGTIAVIEVSLQLSTPARAPLNVTVLWPSAAPKPDPEMFTTKPAYPEEGFRLVTSVVPGTVNATPLLASTPAITTTLPVVAPAGTTVTIDVPLQLLMVAVVPLKMTVSGVEPKFTPVIVT